MRTFAIIAGCFISGILVAMIPMADLKPALSDLITIFTILAGLLAQMIALTAVIFEPTVRMSAESVREVGKSVRGLQTLNIGLFVIYIAALVIFVAIKALQSHPGIVAFYVLIPYAPLSGVGWTGLTFGTTARFIAGFLIALAIFRTFRTLFAIRDLQDLRLNAQARDAELRDRQQREHDAERLRPVPDQGGAGYGEYTQLPRNGGKRKGG